MARTSTVIAAFVVVIVSVVNAELDKKQCSRYQIEGCLNQMISDKDLFTKLSAFQGLTPISLTAESADALDARFEKISSVCTTLNMTKWCVGKSAAVSWWECSNLLDNLVMIMEMLREALPGTPSVPKPVVQQILTLADQLCFSPYGLDALKRNKVCIVSAMTSENVTADIRTLARIYGRGYGFVQEADCPALQSSIFNVISSIQETCLEEASTEASNTAQAIFAGAIQLVGQYNPIKCLVNSPLATTTAVTPTTAEP